MMGISVHIDKDAAIHNISDIKKETTAILKDLCKYTLPYVVTATVFKGLQEAIQTAPKEIVAKYAVNSMYVGIGLCILKGAHTMWQSYDRLFAPPKEATHIILSNEDFESLQNEIIRLRQDVIDQNRRSNFTQRSNGNREFDNIRFH